MGWKPGDCLLIETNLDEGGHVVSHLFVVILECNEHSEKTIIVNIQSAEGKFDRTTILQIGDHEFIKRVSFVNYRLARIVTKSDLDGLAKSKKAKPKQPLSEEVFQRLCEGIMKSPFTSLEVRELYEDYLYGRL